MSCYWHARAYQRIKKFSYLEKVLVRAKCKDPLWNYHFYCHQISSSKTVLTADKKKEKLRKYSVVKTWKYEMF